jgi:hypothetical protein
MWATGLNSGQTDFCFEGGRRKTRPFSHSSMLIRA